MRIAMLVVAAVALVSCGRSFTTEQDGETTIRTDSREYQVEIEHEQVIVDVPWAFRSPTHQTLYVANCNGIAPPVLERKNDGGWEVAYAPIVPQCLSEPITIEAGEIHRDTLRVRAGLPDSQIGPKWAGAVRGIYRLVWDPLTSYDENEEGFGDLLPLELRVSNEFVLQR